MTESLTEFADVDQILGDSGLLQNRIEGFAPRPQQLQMSRAVANAIAECGQLVVEAGTGVGKTFAYLVPALLAGEKTLVSTGTRNLQDQLFNRDLPALQKLLGHDFTVALLKGRANYICPQRLQMSQQSHAAQTRLPSFRAQDLEQFEQIQLYLRQQPGGDLDSFPGGELHPAIRHQVTSTADNCIGQECPHLDECPLHLARKKAQQADLVVINHHLFFADMAIREGGFGEVVPYADVLVFDEAHLLPDIATQFFGQQLSSNQLINLTRDLLAENPGDIDQLQQATAAVDTATEQLNTLFEPLSPREEWSRVAGATRFEPLFGELISSLTELLLVLKPHVQRSKELENCNARAATLLATCHALITATNRPVEPWDEEQQPTADKPNQPVPGAITDPNLPQQSVETVKWLEKRGRGFVLHNDPIEISAQMQQAFSAHPRSWIFTSATLAAGKQFDLFTGRMGLTEAETLLLDTPFDYANQALLYLPTGLPAPNDRQHTAALVEATLPLLKANRGRAFMLFTSYSAMHRAHESLLDHTEFTLLLQGEAPKSALLEQFQNRPNAILLATSSFWQGVDVRGDALSCVIIDKLPFASPSEPLIKARIEALRKHGGNPFNDLQVPAAIITLKQGAGRLIRDHHDRGLLVIGDPRLRGKSYGQSFLNALPSMPVTDSMEQSLNFLTHCQNEQAQPPETR
ncbi:MAG TPA: helicase [Gammaproteobacteria bacterium]|nr:helicase [Gammaproteobacteria bacterium]